MKESTVETGVTEGRATESGSLGRSKRFIERAGP